MSRTVNLNYSLAEFLAPFSGQLPKQAADIYINGISDDSRTVQPGDLFVARAGSQHHGEQFIEHALHNGAAAILVDATSLLPKEFESAPQPIIRLPDLDSKRVALAQSFFRHPQQDLTCVAVTGTNGKTTVTHLVASSLAKMGCSVATLGTLGVGVNGRYQATENTTPGLFELYGRLADLRAQEIDVVVMEVSSHALDQNRIAGLEFAVAAFTNLSRDHLDYHGSVDAYYEAKARLFSEYPVGSAVVNIGDEFGQLLFNQIKAQRLFLTSTEVVKNIAPRQGQQITYCFPQQVRYSADGILGNFNINGNHYPFDTSLIGAFNVSNLMIALGCLLSLSYEVEESLAALSEVKAPPGRMECFHPKALCASVVVDYAHTPEALAAALQAMKPHCSADLWCVFGCGGERDPGKRPLMGAVAEAHAQHVVITDDNPRHEPSQRIIEQILSGLKRPSRAYVEPDRATAIRHALSQAAADDAVLIAGKGHETYQIIADQRLPFDDREEVRQFLRTIH